MNDIINKILIGLLLKMAQKEIWISSHITQPEGVNYLRWCIESVHLCISERDAILVISASGLLPEDLDNIVVYKHEQQMSQFDHIKYIWNQRKDSLSDDAVILFLDDDDMLLSKSDVEYMGFKETTDVLYKFSNPFDEILSDSNIPGLTGLQILGWSEVKDWSNITISQVPSFLEDYKRELVNDFSGTVIRKKYLDHYLSKLKISDTKFKTDMFNDVLKLMTNMSDIMFMNYIEKLSNGREAKNVTVFHRIKCYQSEWQQL